MTEIKGDFKEEVVLPKKNRSNQRFFHVGLRDDKDDALLTCQGECSKGRVMWTKHFMITNATFQCSKCAHKRRWGFGISAEG